MTNRYPKAYNNREFLNGPQGRTIRILAEFLEPLNRFRRQGIRDTIVVFGSARVLPRAEARKHLASVKKKLSKKKLSARGAKMLEEAKTMLSMSRYYEDAVKVSYLLTKWSKTIAHDRHYVICSGGGPGIMEAANRGAMKAGGKSIGLNISLPHEQQSNPYVSKELSFEFHYFFMRKFWFAYLAKAMIMFPGGFGTLDELMEVLTLLQTRKIRKALPIVLYGSEYWNDVLNFGKMLKQNTISREDLKLFRFADAPEEAFEYLQGQLTKLYKNDGSRNLFRTVS